MAEKTEKKTRVKMLCAMAGKHLVLKAGDTPEFPADEAQRHIDAGNAAPMSEEDEAAEDAANAARIAVRAARAKAK